jgi:glycosyltransferase involved in cell wall biosynthesis
VPGVEEVYAASDVFALPSSEEGFGLVYLEAAWHGVPSIGCDVGGVRYAIAHDETGLVTELHNADALTGALRRFRDDPEWTAQLGTAARTRVERDFDPARMAEAHLAAIRA